MHLIQLLNRYPMPMDGVMRCQQAASMPYVLDWSAMDVKALAQSWLQPRYRVELTMLLCSGRQVPPQPCPAGAASGPKPAQPMAEESYQPALAAESYHQAGRPRADPDHHRYASAYSSRC